jgi:hypothetical protein
MHGSRSKILSKKSRPYIYDIKFLALLGTPYIYDISKLRVNVKQQHGELGSAIQSHIARTETKNHNKCRYSSNFSLVSNENIVVARVGAVVEAQRYKPEGRGIDSRWCHWNFTLTLIPGALWTWG